MSHTRNVNPARRDLSLPLLLILLFAMGPSSFGQVPVDGLVAYFPFNGNANDESGNGHHGTVIGAELTTDRFGLPSRAYHFDGVNDYIDYESSPQLVLVNDMSISTWVWVEEPPPLDEYYTITLYGVSGESEETNQAFHLSIYNDGVDLWFRFGHEWGEGNDVEIGLGSLAHEGWNHIVVVRDADLLQTSFFVDGIIDTTISYGHNPTGGQSGRGSIGAWLPPAITTRYFDGVIDDILIYERTVSHEEVTQLFNSGSSGPLAQPGICYATTGNGEPNYPGALISIDPLTGVGTLIGSTGIVGDNGPAVPALAIRSTGEIYGTSQTVSNAGLYQIDASTGAGTFVASTGLVAPYAMTFDEDDVLYAVDANYNMHTVDENTGTSTLIGQVGFQVRGLASDPIGGTLYASTRNDQLITVSKTTGAGTFVGTSGLGGNIQDIHFDQSGNLYGSIDIGNPTFDYISIDKSTGAGTVIGPIGFDAVVGMATRLETPVPGTITVDVQIDSLLQVVPADGDTFAYTITLTNTGGTELSADWWTKVIRPFGDPIDPLSGPNAITLSPFETVVIDTPLLQVPYNSFAGDYSLIAYVGEYPGDTDSDTTFFTKLEGIPCADVDQFQARCRPGGLVQMRIILTNTNYTGDRVTFAVDGEEYETIVRSNGRAQLSLGGFGLGPHTVELVDPAGCFDPVNVVCPVGLASSDLWEEDLGWEIPAETVLYDNYPNPFNPSTTFRYALKEDGHVTLKIYNMLGQEVVTLVNEYQSAGYNEVVWNGRNEFGSAAASGMYIYRMTAGSFVDTGKMILMK